MDAGWAAIIGAVVGAIAGVGGAIVQARSARTTAREADERRRDADARDRLRAFRVEQIKETRSQISNQLDFLELRASGRAAEAEARDQRFWAEPSSRVMNLSLLGDDALLRGYVAFKADLDARSGGTVADVFSITNMRVIVMAQLQAQEQAALAHKPPVSFPQPTSRSNLPHGSADGSTDPG